MCGAGRDCWERKTASQHPKLVVEPNMPSRRVGSARKSRFPSRGSKNMRSWIWTILPVNRVHFGYDGDDYFSFLRDEHVIGGRTYHLKCIFFLQLTICSSRVSWITHNIKSAFWFHHFPDRFCISVSANDWAEFWPVLFTLTLLVVGQVYVYCWLCCTMLVR